MKLQLDIKFLPKSKSKFPQMKLFLIFVCI